MKTEEIIRCRLFNQQLLETNLKTPEEVVHYMGAMQAQEFAMAKWAIGLRLSDSKESVIQKAYNDGKILRTHLMRPTWHFVSPENIRWLLALTAPRVHAINAHMSRKMELDSRIYKKSNDTIIKKLEGGNHLTRAVLNEALDKIKIKADGIRLSLLMMHAELEGIICSGSMMGKQFTYALLEERVPSVKSITTEEALTKFVKIYFTSRGPATLKDFVSWSGLTMKDAKEGFESVKSFFTKELVNGQEYIFSPIKYPEKIDKEKATFLMPDYDEYGMSYKDRTAIFSEYNSESKGGRNHPIFGHTIIVNGKAAGTWQRLKNKNSFEVEIFSALEFSKVEQTLLKKAVNKYTSFMNEKSS